MADIICNNNYIWIIEKKHNILMAGTICNNNYMWINKWYQPLKKI